MVWISGHAEGPWSLRRKYIRKPFTPEQVKEHVVPLLENSK